MLDLSKKLWIRDKFMKEIVTFLEGSQGERLGGFQPACLAGRLAVAGWLKLKLAGCRPSGWPADGWLAGKPELMFVTCPYSY